MNNKRKTTKEEPLALPRDESGVVLLLTMVVLLVLAALGYQLANRVASQRHRDAFIIDYTAACYARDSAVKYALTILKDLNDIRPVERPNEPDFSDLFAMKEEDYRKLLNDWAKELAKRQLEAQEQYGSEPDFFDEEPNEKDEFADEGLDENFDFEDEDADSNKAAVKYKTPDLNAPAKKRRSWLDFNEPNDINEPNTAEPNAAEPNLLKEAVIRGPYGPPWPLVKEPVEIEIGNAKVKIEIEDENAKYPIGWSILDNESVKRETEAGLDTFCEWMGVVPDEIDALKDQLKEIGTIKKFQVEFRPITQRIPVTPAPAQTRRRGTRPQRTAFKTKVTTPGEQMARQAKDFSRLFNSSLIDTEPLARPTIESPDRKESALKYISLWGTTQVNINTATRQVLESTFVFGGDADRIASAIIKKRREKPFADLDELRKELLSFSTSIDKSSPYITTASSLFSIHVTAVSGVARASAVIVVFNNGGKIDKIAVRSS